MKKLLIIALAVSVLCVLLAGLSFADEAKKGEAKKAAAAKAATPAGQKVFTEAKCQMCHTVLSQGIGEPPAKDAKEEAEDVEEDSGPPDLSAAGAGRTAEWLSLFMQKKETLNDKKHMKAFKGSDEDLTALVDWLLALKPVEKKAALKAEKAAGAAAEKGEKAEAGEKSEAGAKGEAGEKGEAGAKAAAGEVGEKSEAGEMGEAGEKGEAGESHEGHDHDSDRDDDADDDDDDD